MNKLSAFIERLLAYDNYLIVGHENPDPDSIGSMLAVYGCLKTFGKKSWMISADPIPKYDWPNIEMILPAEEVEFENAIILDCEPKRTGKLYSFVQQAKFTFNIDHHKNNQGECDYNYIDVDQAATCMIIYDIVNHLGLDMSFEIAQPLYGGILGDTGGFRHQNTTSSVLLAAADLITHGARPDKTAREIFYSKPLEFIKFMGCALSKLKTSNNNQLVWLVLSYQDFTENGVNPQQCDQLIEYARMVENSEIVILFREILPNTIRIGFRSNNINIHQLAAHFGGGGHLLAAGAQLEGSLPDVVDLVITAAAKLLEGELNGRNY
ncbi:MAG: hypothetical protein GX994_06640 [Firmicutes bacterium]|nr:hypothetical protein [Bacillota bacterium]